MITITPERKDITSPVRNKKYSSTIRLWHWLNAIVITGSLLTVLLHSTLLSTRPNAQLIKANLKEKGVNVTDDQARSAAHELSDKGWSVHIYFGYALAALFLIRLISEFFQLTDQVLIRRIKSAYKQYYIIKKNRELARHEFWVKTLYAVFYILLLITVITGFCLVFEDDVPALKHLHFIKTIHQVNMYLILAFIFIHLAGVFLAERKNSKGIVSDMINGGAA
jgi:Ni/Fe-hydrogenase 1 B-type cytochrome subunit